MGRDESVPLAGVDTALLASTPYPSNNAALTGNRVADGPDRHRRTHELQSEANNGLMGRAARRQLEHAACAIGSFFSWHRSTRDKYPDRRAWRTTLVHTNTCVLLPRDDATHHGRSGAAAAAPTITKKLLDPFCGIDFS